MAGQDHFDQAVLEEAFRAIADRAMAAGKLVEIAVYGGSALVVTLPSRVATRDVDAVIKNDAAWLRRMVAELAEERGWPSDWLNDGVKGFLSPHDGDHGAKRLFRSYPDEEEAGLRVFVASPAYLFAMKCMAMRLGGVEQSRDRDDIEALAGVLGIGSAEAAIEIVSRFYPASRVSPKTQLGIEEIFGATSASRRDEA